MKLKGLLYLNGNEFKNYLIIYIKEPHDMLVNIDLEKAIDSMNLNQPYILGLVSDIKKELTNRKIELSLDEITAQVIKLIKTQFKDLS